MDASRSSTGSSPPPRPQQQIAFLQQLQRLLDEGSFTATYKYALLHAIADLCVTRGDDTGDEVTLDTADIVERGTTITLKPGVAYCFRAFYPLITEMVEGAWSQFVRRQNQDVLGTASDLRSFLFGTDRDVLARFPPILREVQDDRCLYCGDAFASRKTAVDHDHLLAERFEDAGIPHDLQAMWKVARWAYGQVERAGGQVWTQGRTLVPLSGAWEAVLGEVEEAA